MRILLVICLLSCVQGGKRVKRIVGGLKAAIPPPLNLEGINAPDESESSDGSFGGESEEPSYSSDGYDNVIVINDETGNSRITGVKESNGQVSFRGIRFAEPPLKRNRFGRPILYYPKGEIDATKYGSPCLQIFNSVKTGSEDCLFLNVRTPSVKATGLPVLFWIHGGGFTSGSGNQYGASALVSKSVIVVTTNYRLGSLGFLGSNNKVISGNSGLFDIRAAFEWTRRYISYFGGDPNRIFPAGQGHGASVATLLAQSSFTADYVRGVIAMSGTSLSSNVVDSSPSETLNSIASDIQCSNEKQLQTFRCLQKVDVDAVLKTDSSLQKNRISKGGFVSALSSVLTSAPIVEGKNDDRFLPYFLNDNPLNALQGKKYPKVPLLIGTTKQETGKLVSGPFSNEVLQKSADPNFLSRVLPLSLLENNKGLYTNGSVNELLKNLFQNNEYLNLISSTVSNVMSSIAKVIEQTTDALYNLPAATMSLLWNKNGGPVYFYSFEHAASLDSQFKFIDNPLYSNQKTSEKVVGHGDELIFLFELQTLEGKPIPEAELKDPNDKKVKQIFVDAVAEFLRTGKPKIKDLNQEWPQFQDENSYVAISPQPKVGKRFRYCQLALWGGFIDKLMDKFCNFPQINSILQTIPNVDKLLQNNLLGNTNLKLLSDLNLNLPTKGQGNQVTSVLGGLGNNPTGQVTHLRVTLLGG